MRLRHFSAWVLVCSGTESLRSQAVLSIPIEVSVNLAPQAFRHTPLQYGDQKLTAQSQSLDWQSFPRDPCCMRAGCDFCTRWNALYWARIAAVHPKTEVPCRPQVEVCHDCPPASVPYRATDASKERAMVRFPVVRALEPCSSFHDR